MELTLGSEHSTDVMVHQLAPDSMCRESALGWCALRGCGEEPQGRLGNLCHISCLCTLQRLVPVLTVDLVQRQGLERSVMYKLAFECAQGLLS